MFASQLIHLFCVRSTTTSIKIGAKPQHWRCVVNNVRDSASSLLDFNHLCTMYPAGELIESISIIEEQLALIPLLHGFWPTATNKTGYKSMLLAEFDTNKLDWSCGKSSRSTCFGSPLIHWSGTGKCLTYLGAGRLGAKLISGSQRGRHDDGNVRPSWLSGCSFRRWRPCARCASTRYQVPLLLIKILLHCSCAKRTVLPSE